MTRFEELSEKVKKDGFMKLPYAEKQEYKAFRDAGEKVVDIPEEPTESKPTDDETVTIKKSAMEEILNRLSSLETGNRQSLSVNSNWEEVETKPVIRTATLRIMGDKYLIDWKRNRKQFNDRTREFDDIYNITLLLPDGTEEQAEMTLSSIAKLDRKEIKILEVTVQKLRKVVGKVKALMVDYENFGKFNRTGDLIDQDVRALKRTFKVELEDKRTLVLDERILNA